MLFRYGTEWDADRLPGIRIERLIRVQHEEVCDRSAERTEAILKGMVQAFEFFDCIPREVWWDNPKTVAVQLLSGRDRKLNRRYAALASHYVFEPLFCMPASGNEKPVVENRVKTLQHRHKVDPISAPKRVRFTRLSPPGASPPYRPTTLVPRGT